MKGETKENESRLFAASQYQISKQFNLKVFLRTILTKWNLLAYFTSIYQATHKGMILLKYILEIFPLEKWSQSEAILPPRDI